MSARSGTAHVLRRLAERLDPPAAPAGPAAKKAAAKKAAAKQAPARPARQQPPLTSTSARGSRTVTDPFFDRFPRFYDTSITAPMASRLNLRHEAIFAQNRDVFDGATVLDIASHDGRWSLAALEAGAKSVIGIEGRPELVEHAYANLAEYGYGKDRVTFVTGDVHEVMANGNYQADVVLCLGFLYHTLRYNELFHAIRGIGPRHLLIDTQARLMANAEAIVYLHQEQVANQQDAIADAYSYDNRVVSGRPNLNAIKVLAKTWGYEVESLSDWGGLVRDNPSLAHGVNDYALQKRMTIRCRNESKP